MRFSAVIKLNSRFSGDLAQAAPAMWKGQILVAMTAIGVLLWSGQALATSRRLAGKPASVLGGSISGGGKVKVSVVGTGRSSTTNASGFFAITGQNLAGKHQVVFTEGKKSFSAVVLIPAGTKVTLQNTKLNGKGAAQPEEEDIEVLGTLSAVDCADTPNSVTIVPSAGGASITMSLDAATTEIDDDSNNVKITDCATLASTYLNARTKAEGIEAADGSIVAERIELNPGDGNGNGSEVRFEGIVISAACPSSIVVQRSDGTNVTVDLSPTTEIRVDDSASHDAASCTDISQGAQVEVEGVPAVDGTVGASRIEVQKNEEKAEGTINSLNCGATPPSLSFTPNGATNPLTVTIGATTQIEVDDNEAASCTDLTAGPAQLEGVTQPDGTVAATEIEQEANDEDHGGGDDNGGGHGHGGDHGGGRDPIDND
jgi:hypothetical protein